MGTDTWKPRRVFVPFQFQYKEQRKQVKTMDAKTYQECALRTMADQQAILYRMSRKDMQLVNGVIGLNDESGELCTAIKAHVEYGKPLDRENIKEEVGDCFWRLRQICDAVGLTFEECMQANIDKLAIRYPKEFSDVLAQEENRDRAAEREAMTPEKVIEKLVERPEIMSSLEHRIKNELPENWDKDPYVQNGQGFAEPPEVAPSHLIIDWSDVDLPSSVHITVEDEKFTVTGHPPVCRKSLNHSYTRYCSHCNIQPIHKANTIGVCTPCFMKHGEPKETENDAATTG